MAQLLYPAIYGILDFGHNLSVTSIKNQNQSGAKTRQQSKIMKQLPIAIAVCVLAGGLTASAQSLAVQLQSANYNPITGVWTDSSGNGDNATYSGSSTPTVVSGATPNGSSAIALTGNGSLLLGTSIPYASGYTVFAFVEPTTGIGRNALTGGSSPNALEYDIYNQHQDYLTEYTDDVGSGAGVIPTTSFSLIDLAVNSSGASFNLNGASDNPTPPASGATFSSAITRIGNNEGGGDGFAGEVAEIDIYTGVLSASQISSVESTLTAEYVTPVPEPTTWALLAGGCGALLAFRRVRRVQA